MIYPYFSSKLRSILRSSFLLVPVLLLTACGNNAERLRFTSELPDEFAIVTLRPLTLPPDYTLDAPTIQSESELSVNQLQDDIRASMLLEGKIRLEMVTRMISCFCYQPKPISAKRILDANWKKKICKPFLNRSPLLKRLR